MLPLLEDSESCMVESLAHDGTSFSGTMREAAVTTPARASVSPPTIDPIMMQCRQRSTSLWQQWVGRVRAASKDQLACRAGRCGRQTVRVGGRGVPVDEVMTGARREGDSPDAKGQAA